MTVLTRPFPRTPDGDPDAWWPAVRFSAAYEERLAALWDAVVATGFEPGLALAGSEGGEVLFVRDPADAEAWLCLIAVEDPTVQDEIDAARCGGAEGLLSWVRARLADG